MHPLQEPSPGGPSLMRTKQGALDSTVQTHLRTKARVCVCVCVCCGGEGGALIVKARVCVCVCVCAVGVRVGLCLRRPVMLWSPQHCWCWAHRPGGQGSWVDPVGRLWGRQSARSHSELIGPPRPLESGAEPTWPAPQVERRPLGQSAGAPHTGRVKSLGVQ